VAQAPHDLRECEMIIEAIIEDIDVKVQTLSTVCKEVRSNAIITSNTSLLSITALGELLGIPERFCGMHFFNSPQDVSLVEVISGRGTDPAVAAQVAQVAESWGVPTVRVKDSPGFIVGRVSRPFYLEALRVLEEKIAGCDAIDLVMREVGGFKYGPFESMDRVGIDVNYSLTCSIYEQSGRPARHKPSDIQARLVQLGKFGLKTGSGFYDYQYEKPELNYRLDVEPIQLTSRLKEAWEMVQRQGQWDIEPESGYLFARLLCAMINEASLVEDEKIATSEDIDVAMKLASGIPKGLLTWSRELGYDVIGNFLRALNDTVADRRFLPSKRFFE